MSKKPFTEPLQYSPFQWLLVPGTKGALRAEDFGPSRSLYNTLTRRFALLDQKRGGHLQAAFQEFATHVRDRHVETSVTNIPDSPHDLYVLAAKGHKTEALDSVTQAVRRVQELRQLIAAPNIVDIWRQATSPSERIVGGFHPQAQFMFTIGRGPTEDAKALFGIPENPGRLKARPDRDPAFFSQGMKALALVEYPQQLAKALSHLKYYQQAGNGDPREAYCLINGALHKEHYAMIEAMRDAQIMPLFAIVESSGNSLLAQGRDMMVHKRLPAHNPQYRGPHATARLPAPAVSA